MLGEHGFILGPGHDINSRLILYRGKSCSAALGTASSLVWHLRDTCPETKRWVDGCLYERKLKNNFFSLINSYISVTWPHVVKFNLPNHRTKEVLFLLIFTWRNLAWERFGGLLEATQLVVKPRWNPGVLGLEPFSFYHPCCHCRGGQWLKDKGSV